MFESGSRLQIDTPENLTLEAEIAGFGSRFLAATVDYILLAVVLTVLFFLFGQSFASSEESLVALLVPIMFSFLLIVVYHLLFELLWNGQTPGKRWLGLRIVQADGTPASGSSIMIRNLVRLFDFLPLAYGVGILALLATRRTQRLGDLAANTIVIYERPTVQLSALQQDLRVRYRYIRTIEPIPHFIDITALTQEDHLGVVSYLQRRDTLTNHWLAVTVAQKVAGRMGYGGVPLRLSQPADAETFLEWVARAFEVQAAQAE